MRMLQSVTDCSRQTLAFMAFMCVMLVATSACATVLSPGNYRVGQIIEPQEKTTLSDREFRAILQSADIIYIGEAHYTPSHVEAALQVLQSVVNGGRKPVLGMEMFSWDGQAGLDRYLTGAVTSTEDFLTESHWKNNWGGKYADYSPLVDFAKTHDLTLLGLNPPRPLVRNVAKQGLAAIESSPEGSPALTGGWTIPVPFPDDDPEYRRVIYDQIEQCHAGLSQEVYEKIYEASVFRDEGMASVISTTVKSEMPARTTFVSYTGAGHIQYGLPIPKRVQRQLGAPVKDVTVYLHALDPEHPEDVDHLIDERIADYVWLTALGPQGRQPRCGE
ncbi:MAG: ChaN family lipoprotein [Nitrospira sp. SB0677_bin_15]|nr:ChaN family lipoprotein [Nitrospira sp. SB0661_bin_20]MYG40532.1 ChaN family lipoprotein [Nitrospira sp. SB0677_bin_15]MYJ22418.1 ChaN family lipoprotein [Nitrospira sp. SB0673_bin_12]